MSRNRIDNAGGASREQEKKRAKGGEKMPIVGQRWKRREKDAEVEGQRERNRVK